MVFGGSGPAAYDKRRPYIDWIHGANVQGNAVRDYTKWDYEPRSLESVTQVVARGYRVAASQPAGPVYIALDAGLQEQLLDEPVAMPDFDRLKVPATACPVSALPTSAARLSRVKLSTIVNTRMFRPSQSWSLMKSMLQHSFIRPAAGRSAGGWWIGRSRG